MPKVMTKLGEGAALLSGQQGPKPLPWNDFALFALNGPIRKIFIDAFRTRIRRSKSR